MATPDKLTCQESVELVTDYLEKALLPEMEARFEAHLATCAGCTVYFEQMEQTLRLLRQLTAETTPTETKQQLLAKFQDWQQGQQAPPSEEQQ
jgi:anti-sigma factor RsiW